MVLGSLCLLVVWTLQERGLMAVLELTAFGILRVACKLAGARNGVLKTATGKVAPSEITLRLPWWLSGKSLPAVQETQEMWVQSLGWEDPLEKEVVTHSSILTWRIPWTEEPGGLQPMGSHRDSTTEAAKQAWFWFRRWRKDTFPPLGFFSI